MCRIVIINEPFLTYFKIIKKFLVNGNYIIKNKKLKYVYHKCKQYTNLVTQLQVTLARKMSRNIKNSAPIQKYCKVCHDAGKSESEYRSHFTRETRDPSSRVVCPTLLALECRYCFKKGHTVKYCAVLKEKDRAPAAPRQKKAEEKPKGKSTNTNSFAVLDSDSEDEEVVAEKVQEVKEEFPALSSLLLKRSQPVSANYASALSRPAPVPAPVPVPETKTEAKAAPWASGQTKIVMKSWAAWDSDSEDEEEFVSVTTNKPYSCYTAPAKQEIDEDW